ncbi:MAG: inositol monophosphatase family protein [bacterium]|nr:inositol monophosphatase family protein [bacterium]
MTTDIAELGQIAIELARGAGELAGERRRGAVVVESTKSSAVDVVTAVDREVEDLLRSRIAQLRPDDAILGEEGDDTPGTSGLTWVLDPIDGTVNYLYGQPAWAVSVAVCEGEPDPRTWHVLAGAVSAPALGHLWHATAGGGAFRDGQPISVGRESELGVSLLATGFAYRSEVRSAQAHALLEVLPHVRDIRRLGSCAIDLCLVADGSLDAYFESGINPWDMAAGEVIVREAGGVVVGEDGGRASGEMVVAGNPGLASAVARLVTNARGGPNLGV